MIFMRKGKLKNKKNEKLIGILIGVLTTLIVVGVINVLPISSAQKNPTIGSMMDNDNMMPMMHAMMMGDQDDMMGSCMSMMKKADMEMTKEQIENMVKAMDKDGDGKCDMCGMSIEACRKMMNL